MGVALNNVIKFVKDHIDVISIFGVGLFLRLIYIPSLDYVPYSDMAIYVGNARDFLASGTFPAHYGLHEQYPLYICFLTGIFALFGQNYLVVRIIQSILSALIGVWVYFLGNRILGQKKHGQIAGMMVAVYPDLVLHAGSLLTETLYTFLLTLSLLVWHVASDSQSKRWYIVTGICAGLALLTRTNIAAFLCLGILWEWGRQWPSWRQALRATLVIGLTALAVCSPWFLRNWSTYGTLTPPSLQIASGFWSANNALADGDWVEGFQFSTKEQLEEMARLSVPEQRAYMIQQGLFWIQKHPVQFIGLAIQKTSRLFGLKPDAAYKGNFYGKYPEAFLPVLAKIVLWPLMLLGLIYSVAYWKRLGLFYALFLSHVIVTAVFFYFARYLVPLIPAMIIFAAIGVDGVMKLLRDYKRRNMQTTSKWATAVLVVLVLNWGWDISRNVSTLNAWKQAESLEHLRMQSLEHGTLPHSEN